MTRQSAYRLRDRAPKVAEGCVLAQAAGRARRKGKRAQGDASGMAR
jgi:hypothetical protein